MAELCEFCFAMIGEFDKCVHEGKDGENIYLCSKCSEKVSEIYDISNKLSFEEAIKKVKEKAKK